MFSPTTELYTTAHSTALSSRPLTTSPLTVWTDPIESPSLPSLLATSQLNSSTYDDANFTGTMTTPGQVPLDTGQIVIAVSSGVICFITVLGNLLILYAFCVDRRLRTYTNYYIVGLSFSDLVAGVFTMPMYTVYWVLGYWPFASALCDVYLYVNHAFIHISVLAILVLAVDRYQAVSQPLKHLQQRTLRHAAFMISISYVVPFLLWLPYTILWPFIVGAYNIKAGLCYPQYVVDSFLFSILSPIFFFWIPLPITSVLYWRIYVVIRNSKLAKMNKGSVMMEALENGSSTLAYCPSSDVSVGASRGDENRGFELNEDEHGKTGDVLTPNVSSLHTLRIPQPNEASGSTESKHLAKTRQRTMATVRKERESKKESNRATRTLTMIFIVLMVSSIPWSVLVIIYCLCPSCIPLVLYQTSVYLTHMNSTVNPFCYAIANPLYIEACTRLLCWNRRRKSRQETNKSMSTTLRR